MTMINPVELRRVRTRIHAIFAGYQWRDLLSVARKLKGMRSMPPGSMQPITHPEMNALRLNSQRLNEMVEKNSSSRHMP